jgi:anti-sigma factor RsiW
MAMATDQRQLTCEEAQPLLRPGSRGQLDQQTRTDLDAHLASCAGCRAVGEEERALDILLEERLPQYPAPLALKRRLQGRLPAPTPVRRRSSWAGGLALAAAAGISLFAWRALPPAAGSPLVAEAVADHLRVIYRDRPVDIESGGPHQVKPWFTGRLDFALPSVFGGNDEFTLAGGSVGYFHDRQAAVLVYKRQLHTISLLVFRAQGLSFPAGTSRVGSLTASVAQQRGFSTVLWQDGELGYALVSDLSPPELVRLGQLIAAGTP